MSKALLTVRLCAAMLAGMVASSVLCQDAIKPPGPADQLPVYIVDFNQYSRTVNLTHEIGNLGAFTGGLIDLRLLELSSVTVHHVAIAPTCGSAPPSQGSASPDSSRVSAFQPTPAGDFYVVHGSIANELPNIVLRYAIDKCENHKLAPLFEDVVSFTLDHALGEITSAAHAIALKIEQAIPPTPIAIGTFASSLSQPGNKEIVATVRKEIADEIQKSSEYNLVGTSTYVINGKIESESSSHNGVTSRSRTAIKVSLVFETSGTTYPLGEVSGSTDQLSTFNAEVRTLVVKGLPQALLAEHLQLKDVASNMESRVLIDQANQLLSQCGPVERECAITNAQHVIQLLSPKAASDPHAWKITLLLGKAYMQAGGNATAIRWLNKTQLDMQEEGSAGEPVSNEEKVDVLALLGDSYRASADYAKAEQYYDEALQMDPARLEVHESKARAYELDDKPVEALKSLLQGLKVAGNSAAARPLHDAAIDILRNLQAAKFDEAEAALDEGFRAGEPLANEYAQMEARRWGYSFDTNWTPETRKKARVALQAALDRNPTDPSVLVSLYGSMADAQLLDGDIKLELQYARRAKDLPQDQVPGFLRAYLGRVLAHALVNNDLYDDAARAADESYHLVPTDEAEYYLAYSKWYLTWCREWKLKLGPGETGPKECGLGSGGDASDDPQGSNQISEEEKRGLQADYQDVVATVTPLVNGHMQTSYSVLLHANHSLGKDRETITRMRQIAEADPTDYYPWNLLVYVCSQYTFDFECAYQAAQKESKLVEATKEGATASAYLDYAEAAVLKQDFHAAENWLQSAAQKATQNRETALIKLYHLWVMIRLGRTSELKTDYDAWKNATEKFRGEDAGLNWTFTGAEVSINRTSAQLGADNQRLLTSMIQDMEDKHKALVAWPEAIAHESR